MQTQNAPTPFLMLFREKSHADVVVHSGVYDEERQRIIHSATSGFSMRGDPTSTSTNTNQRTQVNQSTWTGDAHDQSSIDSDYHSDPDNDSDSDSDDD